MRIDENPKEEFVWSNIRVG